MHLAASLVTPGHPSEHVHGAKRVPEQKRAAGQAEPGRLGQDACSDGAAWLPGSKK